MAIETIDLDRALPFDPEVETGGMSSMTFFWLPPNGSLIPPWWSPMRDSSLRNFWRKYDPFKIAVGTFINKAVTIPFSVKPRERSVKKHVRMASDTEHAIRNLSGLRRGWKETQKKIIQDYLTQDNGCFAYVLGGGNSSRPLTSEALGVYHLDAHLCQRTGDPDIPVLYHHHTGRTIEMHRTRVIYFSNLPSPEYDMFGVGHCAITCALDSAQELGDVSQHSREKFGSRPMRQILYAKKGATIEQMKGAIQRAEEKLDDEGLKLFSKTTVLAPKTATGELELDKIDLTSTPDGFNRQEVTILDMAIVAAAFGLDLHDLALSIGVSGQTRANAEVQARKGRGKGVGEYLETFIEQAERVLLPPPLKFMVDNQDDDQDEQQANIWNIRSVSRQRDILSGSTTVRAERIRMVENSEISEDLYEEMEMEDGRLPDGSDIVLLFYSKDVVISNLLHIRGVPDPTAIADHDATEMLSLIEKQTRTVFAFLEEAPNANYIRKGHAAMSALRALKGLYEAAALIVLEQERVEDDEEDGEKPNPDAPQNNEKTPTTPGKTDPKMSKRQEGTDRSERGKE